MYAISVCPQAIRCSVACRAHVIVNSHDWCAHCSGSFDLDNADTSLDCQSDIISTYWGSEDDSHNSVSDRGADGVPFHFRRTFAIVSEYFITVDCRLPL